MRTSSRQLTLWPAASPVSPSASPANGSRKPTRAGSGRSSPASFAHYDPASRSWRTCPASEDADSATCSPTWPLAGMTRNGIAYQRPHLVRRIAGLASSWLPTPASVNYGSNVGGANGRVGKVRPSLPTMARTGLWPTPRATDGSKGGRWRPNSFGSLAAEVTRYPTPTANDAQNNAGPGHSSRQREGAKNLNAVIGGKLNPRWVEWLMNFPDGWTDLEDSATP